MLPNSCNRQVEKKSQEKFIKNNDCAMSLLVMLNSLTTLTYSRTNGQRCKLQFYELKFDKDRHLQSSHNKCFGMTNSLMYVINLKKKLEGN